MQRVKKYGSFRNPYEMYSIVTGLREKAKTLIFAMSDTFIQGKWVKQKKKKRLYENLCLGSQVLFVVQYSTKLLSVWVNPV